MHCDACHDASGPSAGLSLADEDIAYTNSLPFVTPGDAEGSYLVRKIRGDAGNRMPPSPYYDPMPDDDLQVIKDWINTGAER